MSFSMNWSTLRHLVISGGGPRTFTYCGVLEQLDRFCLKCSGRSLLSHIESAAGTSIGALTLFGFLSGIGMKDMFNILKGARLWQVNEILNSVDVLGMMKKGGLCSHSLLIELIHAIMDYLHLPHNITMGQWYRIYRRNLIINTTCATTFAMICFSCLTTPDVPLVDVLTMTMSVPILFHPYEYDDGLYVDGGVTCNYVAHVFPPEHTIGILHYDVENPTRKPACLMTPQDNHFHHKARKSDVPSTAEISQPKNILTTIPVMMDCMSSQLQAEQYHQLAVLMKQRTITVNPAHIITYATMSSMDEAKMHQLFYYGCAKTWWHFYGVECLTLVTARCLHNSQSYLRDQHQTTQKTSDAHMIENHLSKLAHDTMNNDTNQNSTQSNCDEELDEESSEECHTPVAQVKPRSNKSFIL